MNDPRCKPQGFANSFNLDALMRKTKSILPHLDVFAFLPGPVVSTAHWPDPVCGEDTPGGLLKHGGYH